MTGAGHLPEARAARPEDAESVLQTLCAAFGIDPDSARPLFYRDPFFDLIHKRVLTTPEHGVVSTLTVVPSVLRVGDALVPTAGIAGVATSPRHQRCGHAGRLLSATVGALADELPYPLAALFPYSYGFYRRFGWATASRALVWSGPTACLPPYREAACVRPIRAQAGPDRAAVRRLHEGATRTRTGACRRDARRWSVIEDLTPSRQTVVYEEHAGAIDGYLFFEPQKSGAQSTVIVQEMHARTDSARRGLVGFLARRAEATRVEWEASPEDLQRFGLLSLPSQECQPQITSKPGMMLRLIDVPAALGLLHPARFAPILKPSGQTLTLRAADALRPANTQPIRLHATGVHAGSHADRDWLAADVSVLSQLYVGYLTPSEAASLGSLTASSPEALLLADRLFPARQPFVSPVDQF